MLAFILIVTSLFTPRAIAKFCVNQVVPNESMAKVQRVAERKGCPQLTVTRIDDEWSHAYSVVVYVEE